MSGQVALRDTVGEPGAQGRVPRPPPGSSHLHFQVGKGAPSIASRCPGGGGHHCAVLGTSGLNIALTLPTSSPQSSEEAWGQSGMLPQTEGSLQPTLSEGISAKTNKQRENERRKQVEEGGVEALGKGTDWTPDGGETGWTGCSRNPSDGGAR